MLILFLARRTERTEFSELESCRVPSDMPQERLKAVLIISRKEFGMAYKDEREQLGSETMSRSRPFKSTNQLVA